MIVLGFFICVTVVLVCFHFLLKFSIEDEVERQIHSRDDLARQHQDAVHDIRDELRRTSHRLIATAIDPARRGDVIEHDDLDLPKR